MPHQAAYSGILMYIFRFMYISVKNSMKMDDHTDSISEIGAPAEPTSSGRMPVDD
jgi:hypothetical protein